MSIYQNPKEDIAIVISTTTGLTVTASQFNILKIRPAVGAESTKNTKAYISFAEGGAIRGNNVAYYDRLQLSGLISIRNPDCPTNLFVDVGETVGAMLTKLRNAFGAGFTDNDLEDLPAVAGENDRVIVTLRARPESLGWIGEQVIVCEPLPLIASAFASDTLPGF